MKKFNAQEEANKFSKKLGQVNKNSSKISNMFIPILVVACSFMAMTTIAFSANILETEKEKYNIHVDIINGEYDAYDRVLYEGSFSARIDSKYSNAEIRCSKGILSYDPLTQTISTPYLNHDVVCELEFINNDIKEINGNELIKINDNMGISYYYSGDRTNNYVLLNDMMFRIVRINGNGTIRLILNEDIDVMSFGNTNNYIESNVMMALENWFANNFNNEDYLVKGDYDITNYETINIMDLVDITGYYKSYVGCLSAREATLIAGNLDKTYFDSDAGIYLANGSGISNVYGFKDGKVSLVLPSYTLGVRPVINIKAEFSGDGTIENPFIIK